VITEFVGLLFRVSATSSSIKESVSELVSFTTESCEPDCPAAPKLINRTKNSLSLQWKVSRKQTDVFIHSVLMLALPVM